MRPKRCFSSGACENWVCLVFLVYPGTACLFIVGLSRHRLGQLSLLALRLPAHGDPDQSPFENGLLIRVLIAGLTVAPKPVRPQQTISCLGEVSRRHAHGLSGRRTHSSLTSLIDEQSFHSALLGARLFASPHTAEYNTFY